jgi:hypothetical protein
MTKDDLSAERPKPRGNLWPSEAWVAEIQGATRELLFRLADITIEPGQRRTLSYEEVWRLDEVRATMIDVLQNG